jgi:hypothetical protein
MLHSVRFLQSQWNARSPALSLRDLVEYLRPIGGSSASLEKARRQYQAARIHCFLRGIAVAVDGPLPTTGALLMGSVSDPEFIVSSIRPSLELDLPALEPVRAGLEPGGNGDLHEAALLRRVCGALDDGLLVYVRSTNTSDATSRWLEGQVRARRYPVLAVTVVPPEAHAEPGSLALSEVVVRLAPVSGHAASFH